MAQIIKNRRGSIGNVKDVTTQNGEVIVASGSIGDLSGPFILYGSPTPSDNGLAGVYKPASKIYQGANVPTISVGTYGTVLDGTPFYSSASKALYILNAAGNTLMDLAGNLSGSIFPYIIASGSFSGSFQGNGSGLTDISASSIVGLSLNSIQTGSVTASVNVGTTSFQIVSGSETFFTIHRNGALENGDGINAVGTYSHAEGDRTISSGSYSHAEGLFSIASGEASHAEGNNSLASGSYSHAEGSNTIASGSYSHAEGESTIATGVGSHAEGQGTIALGSYQHVQGTYNIPNLSSLMIIGNGAGNLTRSNIVDIKTNIVEITGSLIVTNGITGSLLGTASYVATASYTPNLQEVTNQGSSTTNAITASGLAVNGPAYISGNLDVNGTITYISSSTLLIGDNIIEINVNKAAGNSGMIVYDTNAPFTASLLWDATIDRWIAGPYGSESVIILASDTSSMSVNFARTASYSTTLGASLTSSAPDQVRLLASNGATLSTITVNNVSSASYALSASYAFNATTASFALTSSYVNPLNQNLLVNGYVSGSTGFYDGTGAGVIQFAYLNASKQLAYLTPSTAGDLIQWNGTAMTASNLIDGGTF